MDNTSYNHDEIIAFIARETHYSLEYIRGLPLEQLYKLYENLLRLKEIDDYQAAYNAAMIVCALVSTKKNPLTPEQIIGPRPRQGKVMGGDLWKAAKEAGIEIPQF